MRFLTVFFKVLITAFIGVSTVVHAQLNINITGVGSHLYPIAVANFRDENTTPPMQQISTIIRNDLMRSGRFVNVDTGTAPIAETDLVNLGLWKAKGADALVVGSVTHLADGNYDVRFRLSDTIKGQNLGGLSMISTPNSLRMSAHKAADYIYQKLLGEHGMFATRISYVVHTQTRHQLQVSDADGQNAQIALSSPEPIISPTWSPDGTKIAYVSFERGKPVVYIHHLPTGQRTIISNQKGSNSAPAWSPDGTQLALALSLTGNTQIYIIHADGSGLRRLSRSSSIDTEPQFSADGQTIYFTSDRGGSPQIYRMPIQGEMAGGAAQRVTFKGHYNTRPRLSPDGKWLAMISRIGGTFKLHLQNLVTGEVTPLTDTVQDESPSFAVNSKYLLYATQMDGKNVLATVSIDGHVRQIFFIRGGSIRDPCWGPMTHSILQTAS